MAGDDPLVLAWRVFAVDADGTLLAPWAVRFGTNVPADAWRTTVAIASCVSDDHEAPAVGCYCGLRGVQDLGELLARIEGPGTAAAIGRVRLSGKMLEGVDIPADDPPTTLRAERAELLQIHLAPPLTSRSAAVADRYPSAEVYRYADADWPEGLPASGTRVRPVGETFPADIAKAGEEAFIADVLEAGFGFADLDDPGAEAAIMKLGRRVCQAFRDGISDDDVASVLFSHVAEPTYAQVRVVMRSALENLCPECHFMFHEPGYRYGEPITLMAAMGREMSIWGDRLLSAAMGRPGR